MQKKIIRPLDRPFARAVAVEMPDFTRVYVSGAVGIDEDGHLIGEGDITEQTIGTLQQIETYLSDVGGSRRDVTRVRVYLNAPLTDENYAAVNAGREEFFTDPEHYPASTVIEISDLVGEKLLIEIDAEAIVPDDGWDVEVIGGEDLGLENL